MKTSGFLSCSSTSSADTKIVGGENADATDFVVSIRLASVDYNFGRGHVCGGTLVKEYPSIVITAAHCGFFSKGSRFSYLDHPYIFISFRFFSIFPFQACSTTLVKPDFDLGQPQNSRLLLEMLTKLSTIKTQSQGI